MFDGRRNTSTPLIYPYHHHPRAPCTGLVLARALKTAYGSVRGSALVLSQTFNFYGIDAVNAFDLYNPRASSTSLVPVCEAVRRIDGTHLVARAQYFPWTLPETGLVQHRLVAVGNSITTTGDTLQEQTEAGQFETTRDRRAADDALTLQGYRALAESVFEVEIDADQLGHELRIQVQACLSNLSGTTAYAYTPVLITVHQEVR